MKLLADGCEKMPHWANQEMSLGEQGLPNAILTSSFVQHLSHFMIALAGQFFSSTQIPVCLGFLAKNNHDGSAVVNELALAA